VFLLGVPVMLVLLIAGPLLLPEYKDPKPGKFDLPSAGMSLAAVLLVIYGLKQVAQDGLGWLAALSVVAGLVIGVAFIQRQRTLDDPLIDLRLFRVTAFTASLATYTLVSSSGSDRFSSSRSICNWCLDCRPCRQVCGQRPDQSLSSSGRTWHRELCAVCVPPSWFRVGFCWRLSALALSPRSAWIPWRSW
jgi:hypothetical protein